MKKILIKILTLVLAFTSLFALSLFTGCDCNGCGGNGDNGGVIPKPETTDSGKTVSDYSAEEIENLNVGHHITINNEKMWEKFKKAMEE